MSQQLTISSLCSALALVALCLVVRAGDLIEANDVAPASLVQIESVEERALVG